MGARLSRVNQLVRQYDRKLYAIQTGRGLIQVWREGEREDAVCLEDDDFDYILRPNPQFILALTDNWKSSGTPVDMGLEPLALKLRQMDSWNRDDLYSSMVKQREENEADQKRQKKNEIRAMAADVRRDIAKATNDIVHRY